MSAAMRMKLRTKLKHQRNSKFKPKGAQGSEAVAGLEIEAWDFSGAWCLGFGASSSRQL
jgi:hypothetical protein